MSDKEDLLAAIDVLAALRGCRDMLRESAKMHRLQDDPSHAVMCDRHADIAAAALIRAGDSA